MIEDVLGGTFLGLGLFIALFALGLAVFMIVTMWRLFEKAGKSGWAAIIPIYNYIVLLEIAGKPLWWIVWLFIPGANLVVAIWVTNMISKSFGYDEAFTVGLLLLPIIFYPLLAFGDSVYRGPYGDAGTY